MDTQSHVAGFVNNKSLDTHEIDFNKDNIIYLSIIDSSSLIAGYIILSKENRSKDIQLKRILIDENYLGIGQEVIKSVENHCIKEFNSNRIWLDVYENNSKAIYIYEKLGYVKYKENIQNSIVALFYEKTL